MLLPQSSAFAALKNRLNSVSSIGYLHLAPRTYVVPMHGRKGSVVEAIQQSLLPSTSPTLPSHSPTFPLTSTAAAPSNPSSSSHPYTSTNTHMSSSAHSTAPTQATSTFDRPNRLKGREEGIIRWGELLDKFRAVQERARRATRPGRDFDDDGAPFSFEGGGRLGTGGAGPGPGGVATGLGVGGVGAAGSGRDALLANIGRGSAPPVPSKDVAAPSPTPPPQKKSGFGKQFGRLGGAVSGRKRSQQ
jgi:vacuole morphology and inheritance protein 14